MRSTRVLRVVIVVSLSSLLYVPRNCNTHVQAWREGRRPGGTIKKKHFPLGPPETCIGVTSSRYDTTVLEVARCQDVGGFIDAYSIRIVQRAHQEERGVFLGRYTDESATSPLEHPARIRRIAGTARSRPYLRRYTYTP
jgi:hypothetical protein